MSASTERRAPTADPHRRESDEVLHADELWPPRPCGTGTFYELVYPDLRRIAGVRMRGRDRGHILQPTALAHEAFLRLVRRGRRAWREPGHFFAYASRVMKNVLLDHAKSSAAVKRTPNDGGPQRSPPDPYDQAAFADALLHLHEHDAQAARVFELRYLLGASTQEAAQALDLSSRTVERAWKRGRDRLRSLYAGR